MGVTTTNLSTLFDLHGHDDKSTHPLRAIAIAPAKQQRRIRIKTSLCGLLLLTIKTRNEQRLPRSQKHLLHHACPINCDLLDQIGRASCRERVRSALLAGAWYEYENARGRNGTD